MVGGVGQGVFIIFGQRGGDDLWGVGSSDHDFWGGAIVTLTLEGVAIAAEGRRPRPQVKLGWRAKRAGGTP